MKFFPLAAAFLAAGLAVAPTAASAQGNVRARFLNSITVEAMTEHLEAFQAIGQANGNSRAAGTPGYEASAVYVQQQLRRAGYSVGRQNFSYDQFIEVAPPELRRSDGTTFTPGEDIGTLAFSGGGSVTGTIVPTNDLVIPATADPSSTSGCEAEDFPAATAGNIALVQRGTCTFIIKVQNAIAAGAVGVIVFNEGNANAPDRIPLFGGTLGELVSVPVLAASYETGVALSDDQGSFRLTIDAELQTTNTFNILADTKVGNREQTIVVGAHLDSVAEGSGINDNGTGTAAILEIARQIGLQNIAPKNRIRFAFWGGEEDGLIGSTYYVDNLPQQQLENIAMNLNFDMLGSFNYVRFVYDGNGSDGDAGPEGSAQIERIFQIYFKRQDLRTAPTAFDGRSDYGPFIEAGIPAGGLFSGAEGIKTRREANIFGGTAGQPYDQCYHEACDLLNNVNPDSLGELGRAAAFAVYYWGQRETLFPSNQRARTAQIAAGFDYKGPLLKR